MLCLLLMVLTACITYGPSSSGSQTEVEKALNNLHDLNATQKKVTFELVDIRNRLLSMPKDSPPTRDLIRQLAVLNKRATELALEVFRADLEYQAAVKADIEAKLEAELLVLQDGNLRLYKYSITTNASSGKRFVVGDLKNTGTNVINGVSVEFNLYDASDMPLEATTSFVPSISAGSSWKFEALIFDDLAERSEFKRLNWDGKDSVYNWTGDEPSIGANTSVPLEVDSLVGVYQNVENSNSGGAALRRRILLSKGNGNISKSGKLVYYKEGTNGEQVWWESSDEAENGTKKAQYTWVLGQGSTIKIKGNQDSLAEGVMIAVLPKDLLQGEPSALIFSGTWEKIEVKDVNYQAWPTAINK